MSDAAGHYFDPTPGTSSQPRQVRLTLPDLTLELTTDRGVFSADRVDAGTKLLLLEAPSPPVTGTFVDLGCGYGPIACTLASRAPGATVWAVDVNERARVLCRANAHALGLANVVVAAPDEVPEDLQDLGEALSDTYFCNFSLFQSIPDSWAIKQLFPVMPIHRLTERPTEHAVIGDITCDPDGKIAQFIDRRDVKKSLPLHRFNGDPYLLGVFLVGAYQEILGDLHNLFGDTHAVHVRLDDRGEVVLDALVKGDTVKEVLDYVEFDADRLIGKLRRDVEAAVRDGRISFEESGRMLRFYEDGLHGYTYLEDPNQ